MGKVWRQRPLTSQQVDFILDYAVGQQQMIDEFNWPQLNYWNSLEWQVIQERLDDRDKAHELYNPPREMLFAALDATPFSKVKVAIYGQDPYPDRSCAIGLAFSINNGTILSGRALPPTLDIIFDEYCSDLHYSRPNGTSLKLWTERGVLLWNAIPSCNWKQSMSHDWQEWALLTKEITTRLSNKGDVVFVFCGGVARRSVKDVNMEHNSVIEVSHPSPRAIRNSIVPFRGSRIFSRINDHLVQRHGTDPIDWKLP